MAAATAEGWFTVLEYAKHLKTSEMTVRRLIDAGKVKAVDISTSKKPKLRIPADQDAALIKSSAVN